MAHTVSFEGSILLLLRYHDTIDMASFLSGAGDTLALASRSACTRVLVDCRGAAVRLSTMDIYDLPTLLADLAQRQGLEISAFKRALLVDGSFSDFAFAENVAVNRGQQVRVFMDEALARGWLQDDVDVGSARPACRGLVDPGVVS